MKPGQSLAPVAKPAWKPSIPAIIWLSLNVLLLVWYLYTFVFQLNGEFVSVQGFTGCSALFLQIIAWIAALISFIKSRDPMNVAIWLLPTALWIAIPIMFSY